MHGTHPIKTILICEEHLDTDLLKNKIEIWSFLFPGHPGVAVEA